MADQCEKGVKDDRCLRLADLCSHAVDYPKKGNPVNINNAPRRPIPFKPDWKAQDDIADHTHVYYDSKRALGLMRRAVPPMQNTSIPADASLAPLADAINRTCFNSINRENETSEALDSIFKKYVQELQFICATHSLSDLPKGRLTEEEVVMGTILAPSSQKKWRKSRVHNMNVHVSGLVRDIRREILPRDTHNLQNATSNEVMEALQRAKTAWELSVREEKTFGGNSFGLVVLGIIFDCMDISNQRER